VSRMTRDWSLGRRQRCSGDEASLGAEPSEADYGQGHGAWYVEVEAQERRQGDLSRKK